MWTGAILAADSIFGLHCVHGRKHVGFTAAHGMRVEAGGRLHCNHGQQLKHMVRNHIPQGPSFFIKSTSGFNADRFGNGNLDVVDAVSIP